MFLNLASISSNVLFLLSPIDQLALLSLFKYTVQRCFKLLTYFYIFKVITIQHKLLFKYFNPQNHLGKYRRLSSFLVNWMPHKADHYSYELYLKYHKCCLQLCWTLECNQFYSIRLNSWWFYVIHSDRSSLRLKRRKRITDFR